MSEFNDEEIASRSAQRHAISGLDRALDKIKRRKGGGFSIPFVPLLGGAALFFLFAPILWVLVYRFVEAPTTVLMIQRGAQGETIAHAPAPLARISPHLVRAVIAAEDTRFCTHKGFDMEAIQAAYEANQRTSNVKRGKVRGGSTISQQTAKNLFLWPARSFVRKGAEAYFTLLIETAWPKRRILQGYLNAAEWGDGVFGAEAAAQRRFGVSAAKLTPRQAALLAAVLPSPNKWSATKPGPYVRRRASAIEARMWALRQQGLDSCVLDRGAAAPPAPKRKPPADIMPPLEPLPPDVALDAGQPVFASDLEGPVASAAPPEAPPLGEGQSDTPETLAPPEDAPSAAPATASAAPAPG